MRISSLVVVIRYIMSKHIYVHMLRPIIAYQIENESMHIKDSYKGGHQETWYWCKEIE